MIAFTDTRARVIIKKEKYNFKNIITSLRTINSCVIIKFCCCKSKRRETYERKKKERKRAMTNFIFASSFIYTIDASGSCGTPKRAFFCKYFLSFRTMLPIKAMPWNDRFPFLRLRRPDIDVYVSL